MDNKVSFETKSFKDVCESFCKGEDYYDRYKAYLKNCQQTESFLKLLRFHLPSAIESVSIRDDVFKVLSVGSGDGDVDLQVVKVLKDVSNKRIFNRLIEPNEYSLNKYRETIMTKLPDELSSDQVTFDITKPQTFQEYMMEEKADPVKFDIVHSVHTLYYVDVEEALAHCYYKELGEKGLIFCLLDEQGMKSGLVKRANNISQKNERLRITDVIAKYGWRYQEFTSEFSIDVTEVFDDQSETGNLMLDFLTQTADFRATMDSQKVQEIVDMIHSSAVTIGGKRLVAQVDNFIIIFKPTSKQA